MSLYFISFFLQVACGAVASYSQLVMRNNGLTHSVIGVIRATGQLATIFFPLLISGITEKKSKEKLVLIICLILGLGFYVPVFFSSSILFVFICYFLFSSFFWSMNPISDGYLTKCCDGNPQLYGKLRSVGTAGYVIFMILFAVTGFPDEADNYQILLNCLILGFVLLVCYVFGPKYKIQNVKTEQADKGKFDLKWISKPFMLFLIPVSISRISTAIIDNFLPSYMTEELNLGSSFTLFIAIGAIGEIAMLTIGGRLQKENRIKPTTLLSLSCLALVLRLIMYVLFKNIVMFIFAQLLHAFTFAGCHSACTSYISKYVSKENYSKAMTLYWCLGINFPLLIGTLLGGFIIDNHGYNTLFLSYTIFPAFSFFLLILFKGVINRVQVQKMLDRAENI